MIWFWLILIFVLVLKSLSIVLCVKIMIHVLISRQNSQEWFSSYWLIKLLPLWTQEQLGICWRRRWERYWFQWARARSGCLSGRGCRTWSRRKVQSNTPIWCGKRKLPYRQTPQWSGKTLPLRPLGSLGWSWTCRTWSRTLSLEGRSWLSWVRIAVGSPH